MKRNVLHIAAILIALAGSIVTSIDEGQTGVGHLLCVSLVELGFHLSFTIRKLVE